MAQTNMSLENSNYFRLLRENIEKYFDLSELKTVTFDLKIDWENLAGETKRDKIRSLLVDLEKNQRLLELLDLLRHERPKVEWLDPPLLFVAFNSAFELSRKMFFALLIMFAVFIILGAYSIFSIGSNVIDANSTRIAFNTTQVTISPNLNQVVPIPTDTPLLTGTPIQSTDTSILSTSTKVTSPIAPTSTQKPCSLVITVDVDIYVRLGPGTIYEPPLGLLSAGDSANIIGRNVEQTWLAIDWATTYSSQGWVSASFVSINECVNLDDLPIILAPPTPLPTNASILPPTTTIAPSPTQEPLSIYYFEVQDFNSYLTSIEINSNIIILRRQSTNNLDFANWEQESKNGQDAEQSGSIVEYESSQLRETARWNFQGGVPTNYSFKDGIEELTISVAFIERVD